MAISNQQYLILLDDVLFQWYKTSRCLYIPIKLWCSTFQQNIIWEQTANECDWYTAGNTNNHAHLDPWMDLEYSVTFWLSLPNMNTNLDVMPCSYQWTIHSFQQKNLITSINPGSNLMSWNIVSKQPVERGMHLLNLVNMQKHQCTDIFTFITWNAMKSLLITGDPPPAKTWWKLLIWS